MDEGKTAIEVAAGHGCMGHDLEHSSMEAAAGQGSVRPGEEVIPGSIRELRVGKNAKGIVVEQWEVNVSLAKGKSAGKGVASDIAEGISKGTAAGQAAKAFAGRPVHNSEAESAASQVNHGLNMGQFTNEIAAGNLPSFQEKVSSIAAGQIAKTVACRHGQGSCSSPRQLQFTETVADRSLYNDRAVAAGHHDRAVATKSGKTSNDAAAGQGCAGLDERQDSMEVAAGDGELGQYAKEATAGDRQHGQYAKEHAAAMKFCVVKRTLDEV